MKHVEMINNVQRPARCESKNTNIENILKIEISLLLTAGSHRRLSCGQGKMQGAWIKKS